jgi:hypothetical protein
MPGTRFVMRALLSALFAFFVSVPALAVAASPSDEALEAELKAKLQAIAPAAVPKWDEANTKREGSPSEQEEAIDLYREVVMAAPRFDAGHRRLCGALARAGELEEALPECEAALALVDHPYNQAALAHVLQVRGKPGDLDRAVGLASAAVEREPREAYSLAVLCQIQLVR